MKHTKKALIITVAYVLCLGILVSLFCLSGAKYLFRVAGYTDFHLADFNGAIFDNTTEEVIKGTSTDLLKTVKGLGKNTGADSDFCVLENCYPGMPEREYPFVITNGTSGTSFATMDISFSVKVRTMCNVPLRYTLLKYSNDKRETVIGTYESVATPTALKRDSAFGSGQDATWYEYTFLCSGGSDNEEQEFLLNGGLLQIEYLSLVVTWPIVRDESKDKDTDSVDYMEEVELIQLIAALTSEESSTENQPIPIYDVESEGVVIIDPSHKVKSYQKDATSVKIYTYQYQASYEAFLEETGAPGVYDYKFTVTNGNNIIQYDDNGVRIETQPTLNLFYRIRFMAPYDKQTNSYTYSLVKEGSSTSTQITYKAVAIEYRLYNVLAGSANYGTYKVLSKAQADEELTNGLPLSQEIFTVYAFYPTESEQKKESVNRLINQSLSGEGINDRFSEDKYVLKLNTSDIKLTSVTNEDYVMYILTEAIFQDSLETPEIPKNYVTWPEQ